VILNVSKFYLKFEVTKSLSETYRQDAIQERIGRNVRICGWLEELYLVEDGLEV